MAAKFCESREGRLCTSKEICPGGELSEPVVGITEGDSFIPVGDGIDGTNQKCPKNTYLDVGAFLKEERLCRLHDWMGM
jgi:hypothetical protein